MFTYTEAKVIINELGRFTVDNGDKDDYTMVYITTEDGSEYMLGTDNACDIAWNDYLDSYIEDCVIPEIPEAYKNYFDNDKFKDDCRFDGRGHSLSSYDGNEWELPIINMFAYRIA